MMSLKYILVLTFLVVAVVYLSDSDEGSIHNYGIRNESLFRSDSKHTGLERAHTIPPQVTKSTAEGSEHREPARVFPQPAINPKAGIAYKVLRERHIPSSKDLRLDSSLQFDIYDHEAQFYPMSVTKAAYEQCFKEDVRVTTGTDYVSRRCPWDSEAIRGFGDGSDIKEKTMIARQSISSCRPRRFPPKVNTLQPLPDIWPACPLQNGYDPSEVDLQVGAGFSSSDFAKLAKLLRGEYVDPTRIGSEKTQTFITATCSKQPNNKIVARAGEEMQIQSGVKLELPNVIFPKDLYDKAPEAVKNLPYMKIKPSGTVVHEEALQNLMVHCGSGFVMVSYTMVLYENVRKAAEITKLWVRKKYDIPNNLQEEIDSFDTRKDVRAHVLQTQFQRTAEEASFSEEPSTGDQQRPLNVLMLMLDSVSRGNFYRTMPQTLKYFHESLKDSDSPFRLYDFQLNNVIGQNSVPNQNPMLSGYNIAKLPYMQLPRDKNTWTKQAPWVFDWLEAMGYVTALGEQLYTDKPASPEHTSIRRYFWKDVYEPADYNNDHLAMTHWGYSNYAMDQRCQLGRRIMQITNECIVSFHQAHYKLEDTPTFMVFHTFEGHDSTERAQNSADMDTKILLETMAETGLLDNTIVILNADHGLHYGPLLVNRWAVEEQKNPTLFMLVPTQLVENNPDLDRNLATNQKRLLGPYDVFATLLHAPFLHMGLTDSPAKHERGISLFQELPAERNCEAAGLPSTYCQCMALKEVDLAQLKANPAKVIDNISYNQMTTINEQALAYVNDMVTASPESTNKCATIAFKDLTTVRTTMSQPDKEIGEGDSKQGGVEVDSIILTTSQVQSGTVEHQWRCHAFIPNAGERTPKVRFVHRMSSYTKDRETCGKVENMKHYEHCVCKEAPVVNG